jgi:putative NADPH-quinone reductase
MIRLMKIAVIQGHPDPAGGHFCNALADAYVTGAKAAAHEVRVLDVAQEQFPLLRTKEEFEHGAVPAGLQHAQQTTAWAEHLVVIYPLWLGGMPAFVYRWYFGAHSLKSLQRNILNFVGIKPVRSTLIGLVETLNEQRRRQWLAKVEALGRAAR